MNHSADTPTASVVTIPEGVAFTGKLVCDCPDKQLLIGGKVTGSIRSAGPVVILESGVLEGSVRAPRITIAGRVLRGSQADGIVADGQLSLAATGKLQCNAVYEEIAADRGAAIAGILVPFNSDFFHELSVAGSLPFVDALEPLSGGQRASSTSPSVPAPVPALAGAGAGTNPTGAAASAAAPVAPHSEEGGSAASRPSHLRPVATPGDAGSLRSLEVGGAGSTHLGGQHGESSRLGTGTHGHN
jgi:cytoskeletal protein CcmA (bactofilin family)